MLLRNSISSTKRFFQKTLHSFKSLFSGSDYQRLPKSTPPHMNIQTTYGNDFDTFYADHFTNQWEPSSANNNKEIKAIKKQRPNKKNVINNVTSSSSSSPMKQESEGFMMKGNNRKNLKTKTVHHADSRFSSGRGMIMMMREERSCLLAEMLKELELMDMSNVDHVLDIEEFLHYYSRLTCPAYVDIVDKFFIEIYAEFFGHHSAVSTPACISSRPNKLRS